MRRALDGLYLLSGALAALFMICIAAVVLAQVACNIADWAVERIAGRPLGLFIPSYAEFAGYCLVGATFFALAYSFRNGALIRVNILLIRLSPGMRRVAEIVATAVSAAITAYLAYYMARLTYDSWRFGDVTSGLVPIPLWVPQLAMTSGTLALLIACLDSCFEASRGETPGHVIAEGSQGD